MSVKTLLQLSVVPNRHFIWLKKPTDLLFVCMQIVCYYVFIVLPSISLAIVNTSERCWTLLCVAIIVNGLIDSVVLGTQLWLFHRDWGPLRRLLRVGSPAGWRVDPQREIGFKNNSKNNSNNNVVNVKPKPKSNSPGINCLNSLLIDS